MLIQLYSLIIQEDLLDIWAGGITEEDDVLYYSKLLDGHKWGADGGFIDLKSVWGQDTIVAIHSFAGKLVIFGKENIAIYNSPDIIANIALDEVIRGIGCVLFFGMRYHHRHLAVL